MVSLTVGEEQIKNVAADFGGYAAASVGTRQVRSGRVGRAMTHGIRAGRPWRHNAGVDWSQDRTGQPNHDRP